MKATESRAAPKVGPTQTGTLVEWANRARVCPPMCVSEPGYLAEARRSPRGVEDAAGVQGVAGAVVATRMATTARLCQHQ